MASVLTKASLFGVVFVFLGISTLAISQHSTKKAHTNIAITKCDTGLNLMISQKPFEVLFNKNSPESMGQLLRSGGYHFGINGGYFDGNSTNAQHAGYLRIHGEELYGEKIDPQITTYVALDYVTGTLDFINNESFSKDSYRFGDVTIFQAGPMIVRDSVVETTQIKNSYNGEGKYYRTFLGYVPESKEFLYGIACKKMDLYQVNEILQSNEKLVGKKFSVINLDGGPSTALYAADNEGLNFNTTARLPVVIGVK